MMLDLATLSRLHRPGVSYTEWGWVPERDAIWYRLWNDDNPRRAGIQVEIAGHMMRSRRMSDAVTEVARQIECAAGLVYWLGATRFAGR